MASISATGAYLFLCVLFLIYSNTEGENIVWTDIPPSASGIEGQSVNIKVITDLREFASGTTWSYVEVYNQPGGAGSKDRLIKLTAPSTKYVFSNYRSRAADLTLTVTKTGTVVTIVFTIDNLNKTTDAKEYRFRLETTAFGEDSLTGTKLTVLVSPEITFLTSNTTVNETQILPLICNASGIRKPNITWTRNGVEVGTGSPFKTSVLTPNDDKSCYTCIASNEVPPSKSASTCLNVQYTPKNPALSSDRSTVCLNENVTLTCTFGTANPSVTGYDFYNNNVGVGSSQSNVFVTKATSPNLNTFECAAKNLLGASAKASFNVTAKVAPVIVTSPIATTVIEGNAVNLFCNASGQPAPTITWTKVGWGIVGSGDTYSINVTLRGHDGTYRCTASNAVECKNATAEATVTVNYKPENTTLSTNKSDNTFLKGESVKLSCTSASKPPSCNVTFLHGSTPIGQYSSKTCAGGEVASHVIESIGGCNEETYSCKAKNEYGYEESKINLRIKAPATVSISPLNDLVRVEGDTLQLNCTATGCPTPNITWTKTGVSASLVSGNSFFLSHQINSLSKGDTGHYVCTVDNGVVGSPVTKTIHVNVTYKPYQTTLSSTLTKACLNDSVTLTCTTNANPPAHEYRFYLNDKHVHSSSSGVYQLNVPQAGNNTYKCAPKNTVGFGGNASMTVFTKEPPKITFFSPSETFVEGVSVVLMCNVTGSDPMNVTLSKVGGTSYPEGYSRTFQSIGRGDEATYQCTAHNGNECPVATARSSITVIYEPENTLLTTNKSTDVFVQGESVNLTCKSSAKPAQCYVLFYKGDHLLINKSSSTCTASHVLTNIQGCNNDTFSCYAENEAGKGKRIKRDVTIQVPANMSVTPSTNTVVLEERNPLSLTCTATGCPTPNITWTKNGVAIAFVPGNGSTLVHPFSSLLKGDTGTYDCTVDNGVIGSPLKKTIYLNVTYKPYQTNLTSTLSKACVNDSVTLECTTNANPPAHEYRFYLNGQLVHTSSSGVYHLNVPQAGNNTYKCEPKNTIGFGVNASVEIRTKAPPKIYSVSPSNPSTFVEGTNVVLMCNVTGSDPMTVTWSKVGGTSYPEGYSRTFQSIGRGDEATYQCTAHNGNECPAANANTSITVIYKPENTTLTTSTDVACLKDEMTLTCRTKAKPPAHKYKFYRNGVFIADTSTGNYTYNMNVNGTNTYTCEPINSAGNGTKANVTVQVKVSPVIVGINKSQAIIEGTTDVSLVCDVFDLSGNLNVSWHKVGGGQVSSTNSYTISVINRNDSGSYECKAHNGNECPIKKNVTKITVTYPPFITEVKPSNQTVSISEHEEILLTCKVSGNPKPIVNWTRNGVLINFQGEEYKFNGAESLSAEYTCIAYNGIGANQNKTFGVTINGYCNNHQCKHGSTCKTKVLSYICLCKRGLTGQFCDIEDPIDIHYDVILIIDKTYVEQYEDVASTKSETDMKNPICTKMFNIFNVKKPIPYRRLNKCVLKMLRKGSVISNTELTFNASVLRSEILERINAEIEKVNDTYKFGNLTLKSSEVKVDQTTDACSSEPCKFNSKCLVEGVGYKCECDNFRYGTHCEKGIGFIPGLIIILACILIIIIAIILICLYCQRKKTNTYPSGNVAIENGTQMKVRGDHPEAANNVAIQDENKVNGEPIGTYRPDQTNTVKQPDIQQNHTDDHDVTYAELSFTKNYDPQNEKTQTFPKEKTETIYSDIVSVMKNTDEKPEEKIKLEEEGIEMKEKEQAELEEEGTEMKEKEQNEDQETKKDNTNEDTQQTDDPSSTGAETKPEAGGENNMPDNPSLNTSTSIDEKAV